LLLYSDYAGNYTCNTAAGNEYIANHTLLFIHHTAK